MSVLEDRHADQALSPEKQGLRIFLQLIRPRPLADPYPLYGRLRDLAPFLPIRFPGVPNGFLVSTYAGCDRLLRDSAFGPPTYEHLDALKPDWRDNAFTSCLYSSMVFRTGKDHRQRRQTASRHFAPRHIGTYRAELESIADMLIDRMDGTVDLIEELALPFAGLSLGRLMGIADDEAIQLGRLARQAGGVFEQFASAKQHETIAAAGEELVDRLTGIVKTADSDLLASLAASAAGADQQELVGAAVLLFGAGFDSPASMVGLGTKLLLDHPDQARLVPGNPARAVAEILRYEPPVQLVVRAALQPAELEGWPVPAGSMVFGLIAAANRDPAQVKEPETFDVTREQAASLSFGAGPHYCLGAYLAGMQGEILFPRLLRRFPAMRPAGEPVYREPGSTLRGLERLPLTLRP
jgi:cytochrome P450